MYRKVQSWAQCYSRLWLNNDIKPLNSDRNLLEKFAGDLTLSVPQEVNIPDLSVEEVENVKQWAIEKMK